MWKLLVVVAFAGCTTSHEVERPFLVRVDTLGSDCPAGVDIELQLARESQNSSVEFDSMSCGFEQQLYVSDAVPDPSGVPGITVGCCYRTTCVPLDAAADARLFDAACLAAACRNVDLGSFTADVARARLAATDPECSLDESLVEAIDVPAMTCWYEQYARYTCS